MVVCIVPLLPSQRWAHSHGDMQLSGQVPSRKEGRGYRTGRLRAWVNGRKRDKAIGERWRTWLEKLRFCMIHRYPGVGWEPLILAHCCGPLACPASEYYYYYYFYYHQLENHMRKNLNQLCNDGENTVWNFPAQVEIEWNKSLSAPTIRNFKITEYEKSAILFFSIIYVFWSRYASQPWADIHM